MEKDGTFLSWCCFNPPFSLYLPKKDWNRVMSRGTCEVLVNSGRESSERCAFVDFGRFSRRGWRFWGTSLWVFELCLHCSSISDGEVHVLVQLLLGSWCREMLISCRISILIFDRKQAFSDRGWFRLVCYTVLQGCCHCSSRREALWLGCLWLGVSL